MKLLANENFPLSSFHILFNHKVDIKHIGTNFSGITDEEVMNLAFKENRIIVTFDSDYGELIFKKGLVSKGVIFLRWKEFKPDEPGKFLFGLIQKGEITFKDKFTVIDNNQIRQRSLPV